MLFFKTKMGMFKAAQEGVTISKNKWFSGVRASITQGSAGVDWWRGREHRKKKQESEGGVGGWGEGGAIKWGGQGGVVCTAARRREGWAKREVQRCTVNRAKEGWNSKHNRQIDRMNTDKP
jgi:hypothetical protein